MNRKYAVALAVLVLAVLLGSVERRAIASGISSVSSVFGQVGAVNIPVTTTDISTPSNPAAGKTKWYTKAGALCSLSPGGAENCTGSTAGLFYQTVQSAGSSLSQEPILNFVSGVTCVDNSGATRTDCTGTGGAAFYQTVQNAGTPLTQRAALNFLSGVTCVDNSGANSTDCTGSGGGGGSSVNWVQGTQCRGNTVTTCAFRNAVVSANALFVGVGWTGGAATDPTVTDTLLNSYTVVVSLNGAANHNCAILEAISGSSGANTATVVLPAGASFDGIMPLEFKNVSSTTDGSVTQSINSGGPDTLTGSMTTTTAGDLILSIDDGDTNVGFSGCMGLTPANRNPAGADNGIACWGIQNVAGKIAMPGAYSNDAAQSVCTVAIKHL